MAPSSKEQGPLSNDSTLLEPSSDEQKRFLILGLSGLLSCITPHQQLERVPHQRSSPETLSTSSDLVPYIATLLNTGKRSNLIITVAGSLAEQFDVDITVLCSAERNSESWSH